MGLVDQEIAITNQLMDLCTPSSPVEFIVASCGKQAVQAVRRYLPHGRPTDLYWQYLAWHEHRKLTGLQSSVDESSGAKECVQAASWSTFWRVYQKWREVLRPRAESDHAKCQTCYELQTQLYCKHAAPQEKMRIAHAWRTHLQHQYLDRQIYWSLRAASQDFTSPILTIIIDSMDRKKTVYPKWTFDRAPKQIATLGARPRLVVTAALAHGYVNSWFLAPDELPHGSDAYIEVLCQVISQVEDICKQQGRGLPPHLVLQADNTVSQTKNGIVGGFAAYLVGKQLFQTVTINFLMVGHTHEDVDQCFGLLVSQVIRRHKYETPEELRQYTEAVLGPGSFSSGSKCTVQKLEVLRGFSTWLQPLGVHQLGCWQTRDGLEAPHSFTYKLHMDMKHTEKASAQRHRMFGQPDPKDVMCCIKTYMRDRNLQQPPICVLPQSRLQSAGMPIHPTVSIGPSMPQKEQERLKYFAQVMDEDIYGYHRAAASIRDLIQMCNRAPVFSQNTSWLTNPGQHDRQPLVLPDENPFFAHLPESSWHMRVEVRR